MTVVTAHHFDYEAHFWQMLNVRFAPKTRTYADVPVRNIKTFESG